MADHIVFDRELLRRRRDRAARQATSEPPDFLLRRVADDIAWRLSLTQRTFPVAVNLGAHNGAVSRTIRALPGSDLVIDADPSLAMLAHCDGPCVQADEEFLPFKPRSLDLVVSGLSLQWVNDLPGTLVQIERALKPDGLLVTAMLGGATLTELRQALILAETELADGAAPRVAPFADVRDLGSLLQRAGFALPVTDSDVVEVGYDNAFGLIRDLRAMGAANVLMERAREPLGGDTLMRAAEIYGERFSRPDGRITATFEILTLTGWSPHESQQKPLRPGAAKAKLADVLEGQRRPPADNEPPSPDGDR